MRNGKKFQIKQMKNLIIGNTSQISYFFPSSYDRISSRNIDFLNFKNVKEVSLQKSCGGF